MPHAFSRSLLLLTALSVSLSAQKGVPSQWEIAKTLEAISAHAKRVMPMLDQIQPREWVSKGAPDTYVKQWTDAKAQAKALADAAAALSRAPEKLSGELEAYFRLQGLESQLVSLAEGIRKYQNPSLADLFTSATAENGGNRERLQQYIVDLAAEREQEFQIADREAQRCRGVLARQPQAEKPASKPPEKQ